VDAINGRHLAELSGEAVRFVAQDSGKKDALDSACTVRTHAYVLLRQMPPQLFSQDKTPACWICNACN
jgi:hypothetical protein